MIYEDRFLQNLQKRISEDIGRLHAELGNGSQIIPDDAAATGMKCTRHIGMISGLKLALIHIQAVETEMSGKAKEKEKKPA